MLTTTDPLGTAPATASPVPYFHGPRIAGVRWWRGLLLAIAVAASVAVVCFVAGAAQAVLDLLAGRSLDVGQPLTTTGLLILGLGLAALIPIALLLQWAITGQRPGTLLSIAGRVRWRWLGTCLLAVLPIWLVYAAVVAVVGRIDVGLVRLPADAAALFAVIVFTIPLQAAAEEVVFRGVLLRAVASWIPIRALAWGVATAFSATLFMLAHGAQDPWLNIQYFVFAVVASALVWTTGGLEAGIAVHVVNNVVFLSLAALSGGIGGVFDRGAGSSSFPLFLLDTVELLLAAVVLTWLARRRGLARPDHDSGHATSLRNRDREGIHATTGAGTVGA